MGSTTSVDPWAYDNERPGHVVEVAPFTIDTALVTNGQYMEYIDAGGTAPEIWEQVDGSWWVRRFGQMLPVAPDEPVQHVSWHDADAYARWLGRRPHNRGVVMNPVDHPHGGGEGRTSGGRHPVTPWGKPTKGARTRSKRKSNRLIVRSRHLAKKRKG